MTTRTTSLHGRRGLSLDLASLAVALVALTLPVCTLHRSARGISRFAYDTAATLRTAEGVTLRVTGDDALLAGGTPRSFSAEDADVGGVVAAERVRSEWKRYLFERLSDPALSPEARAVFGDGPWCAVDTDVARTEASAFGPVPAPLTGAEIPGCTGGMVAPVSDCPTEGVAVPMLGVSPTRVAFPATPVGTTSPVEEVITISNVGTGRICLAMPALDLASSEHPEYFPIDASGCMHAGGMREIELERTFLWDRRPSCDVRVRFAPGGAAVGVARLRLNTNDPVSPVTFIDITGTAQPGFLHPVPPSACFNTPAVVLPDGRTCRRNSVNLVNDGPGFVTVRSLALPADAAAAGWSHDGAPPLPRTVAPAAALSVPLLACGAVGADSILTVGNNGTASTIEVPLLRPGSGCTP